MAKLGELLELMVEEGKAFETMLGRMTISWAEAEYSIYQVLLHYARVPDPIGRSIFSGMQRAKPMMDAITAILENTDAPQARSDNWAFVSAQISAIQTMRDMLTHHLASAWTTKGVDKFQNFLGWPLFHRRVSNAARARRKETVRTVEVNSELIGQMCRDLRVIVANLERHTAKGRFKPLDPPDPAWLYKFPQPKPQRSRTRPKTPKPKRPQKSSRA